MHIAQAHTSDAPAVAAVLQQAAQWLADAGRPLWSPAEFTAERLARDAEAGLYFIARRDGALAGVVKFELEDPYFWPEVPSGSSAFVHKLAVHRDWAKQGVSTALLNFARERARDLGRAHLRLDCVADRQGLRRLYEHFGFTLHSYTLKGELRFARYTLSTAPFTDDYPDQGERPCTT